MNEMITVCCRLPNGFIFNYPSDDVAEQGDISKQIRLKGANTSHYFRASGDRKPKIILEDFHYGTTQVPKEIWERIQKFYPKDFPPFKSGAIFAEKNDKRLDQKIQEMIDGKVKTGFESGDQKAKDITPVDKKEIQ